MEPMPSSPIINIGVDQYSLGTWKLTMFRETVQLAIGTGFLWRIGNQNVLVTAWHCVTGTHPETGKSLSNLGGRPDRIEAGIPSKTGAIIKLIVPLYDDEGRAEWFVHQLGPSSVDIAVMRIPVMDRSLTDAEPLNDLPSSEMQVSVGDDVFLIGYPRGLERHGLPIWKRGSVAIDPAAATSLDGSRTLLIDTATREGLSGGPVLIRSVGLLRHSNGNTILDGKLHTKIIGLYSGRIASKDGFEAQVGIVWPTQYITEVLLNGVRDTFRING